MINVYIDRHTGSTPLKIHQGEGAPDETFVIGDLLAGEVTVHGKGVTPE